MDDQTLGNLWTMRSDDDLAPTEAQANATIGAGKAFVDQLAIPGKVAKGQQPQIPGQWSEEDQFRTNADQQFLTDKAAPSAALQLVTGGMAGAEEGAAGVFGGKLAKTANRNALVKAQRMAEAGASRESIWNQTGWFKDLDKNWKFEIPDQRSKANITKENVFGPVDQVLDHPELYEAYPSLRREMVDINPNVSLPMMQKTGGWSPGTRPGDPGLITARVGGLIPNEQARGVLLHELQHGVENIEGFSGGGNLRKIPGRRRSDSDDFETYTRAKGEVEARNVQTRMDFENRQVPPWQTEDVPQEQQIVGRAKPTGRVESTKPEYIVGAAVQGKNGNVYSGATHGTAYDKGTADPTHTGFLDTDGFLTSTGRYVNRRTAGEIAQGAGQVSGEALESEGGNLTHRHLAENEPQALSLPKRKSNQQELPVDQPEKVAADVVDDRFRNAPYPNAPYPHYAEEYPPVGPPELKNKKTMKPIAKPGGGDWSYEDVDPVTGETLHPFAKQMIDSKQAYWGKVNTPEAEEFQKARAAIQKDMDKNGYEPYFDPNKRADVDPKDYPTSFNSIEEANPKKAETLEKWTKAFDTPEARDRLQKAYERGRQMKDAERWYWMKQIQDEFVQNYGGTEGKARFKSDFADPMAATTGGATPTANYLMAHYANYLRNKNMPTPPSHQMPFPIGGRYAGSNMEQYENTLRNPEFTGFGLGNEKRHDFSNSFLGHNNMPVIDEQMSGMIVPGMQQPDWYGPAAKVVSDVAKKNGVDAREFQEVAWAGQKAMKTEEKTGKPFVYEGPMIQHINASIERTHRLTGMPRSEIVRRGVVKGEIPMYSGIGALSAGAIANAVRQRQQQDAQ